jgi:hypothetical protein
MWNRIDPGNWRNWQKDNAHAVWEPTIVARALASEGKPIVVSEGPVIRPEEGDKYASFAQLAKEMLVRQMRANVLKMLQNGRYEELYYLLMDLKLIGDLDSLVSFETFQRAFKSVLE